MKNLLTLSFCVLLLSACEKKIDTPSIEHNPIDLSDPRVGQVSCYVEYEALCSQGNFGYSFSEDTLIVKVIEEAGEMKFMEYLTMHSPSHIDGSFGIPKIYPVHFEDKYMLIPERQNSELFFFYGNDTIWTKPEHDTDLNQNGCFLYHENGEQFIGEEIGYSETVTFGPITRSQKTVVSCVPVILALDAYIVYDLTSIQVSHTILSTTSDYEINGWVLIR